MRRYVPKTGSTYAADVSLGDLRGRRQRLAASVRSLLLDIDRYHSSSFPNARKEHLKHEKQCLEEALSSLLRLAPEIPLDKNDPLRDVLSFDKQLGLAK
jgi:hypothetical protein